MIRIPLPTISLSECAELYELIDNKRLLRIMDLYRIGMKEDWSPTLKSFLYHEDQELSTLAVSIMDFKYEISPNWKNHYEGKIASPEELYREDVRSTMRYLRDQKNQAADGRKPTGFAKPHTHEERLILADTHNHLKEIARSLAKEVGMTYSDDAGANDTSGDRRHQPLRLEEMPLVMRDEEPQRLAQTEMEEGNKMKGDADAAQIFGRRVTEDVIHRVAGPVEIMQHFLRVFVAV